MTQTEDATRQNVQTNVEREMDAAEKDNEEKGKSGLGHNYCNANFFLTSHYCNCILVALVLFVLLSR